jgi:hypothetical protein
MGKNNELNFWKKLFQSKIILHLSMSLPISTGIRSVFNTDGNSSSRWNISTNEPVLKRLLKFTLIAHLVWAREPPKVKKSKIGVARKPVLIEPN